MSAVVLVVGDGLLADLCVKNCHPNTWSFAKPILRAIVPGRIDLALVLHDAWNPSVHQKAEEVFVQQTLHGCVALFHLERA